MKQPAEELSDNRPKNRKFTRYGIIFCTNTAWYDHVYFFNKKLERTDFYNSDQALTELGYDNTTVMPLSNQ